MAKGGLLVLDFRGVHCYNLYFRLWAPRWPSCRTRRRISGSRMEIGGHKTEIRNLEKTFCDKVFQECDLMATNCVQELMMQTV